MPKRKAQRAAPEQDDPIRAYAMWQDRTGRSSCTPLEWQRQAVTEPFYIHLPPPHGLGLKPVLHSGARRAKELL